MFTINLKKFLFTVAFCLSFIGGTAQTGNGSQGNSTTTTTRSLLRVISKGLGYIGLVLMVYDFVECIS